MTQRFLPCDRDQQYLMPASLRDWLPGDHLAWFVLDAVSQLDLTAFYERYREDGWGRKAYEPSMMVALVLYAYCEGERSSRQIERRCREDIALRVLTANQHPARRSAVSKPAARGGALGTVRRGAQAVRRGWSGAGRGGRARRDQAARQRQP